MKVQLSMENIQKIALFQKLTGAHVMDFYDSGEELFFVVAEGEYWFVIGRNGSKIRRAENAFKKLIKICEYSKDLRQFVRNIVPEAHEIMINGSSVRVIARGQYRARIIGKNASRVRAIEFFLKRLHGVEEFKV